MVELQIRPPAREATVSYLVMPDLRGQGIAPRALEAALGWVAREHGLRTATVQCHVDNIPSRRVAEKCGFVLSERSGVELSFRRDLNEPDESAK
jgi:RimJ/RimL family protein N-acetyltransferase